MTSDEQRVRTEAGWIGVELSRSRVRTPGKAGFGLYRVRGSIGFLNTYNPDTGQTCGYAAGKWTGYLFTLDAIAVAVAGAIREGRPAEPGTLRLRQELEGGRFVLHAVPTRWTSAYRGRRDLGCGTVGDELAAWDGLKVPVTVRPEYARELDALTVLVDAGLIRMRHVEGCSCRGTDVLMAACVRLTKREAMPRRVRRENSAAFQREHKQRRVYGKARYHAFRLGMQTSDTPNVEP